MSETIEEIKIRSAQDIAEGRAYLKRLIDTGISNEITNILIAEIQRQYNIAEKSDGAGSISIRMELAAVMGRHLQGVLELILKAKESLVGHTTNGAGGAFQLNKCCNCRSKPFVKADNTNPENVIYLIFCGESGCAGRNTVGHSEPAIAAKEWNELNPESGIILV